MIKETKQKLHLVEASRKNETLLSETVTISINFKNGVMNINRNAFNEMKMNDKFIKFYYSTEKKILAWTLSSSLSEGQLKSKNWKLCKLHPVAKSFRPGIKKVLKNIKPNITSKSLNLEVMKYKESDLGITKEYFYVEVKEPNNPLSGDTTEVQRTEEQKPWHSQSPDKEVPAIS